MDQSLSLSLWFYLSNFFGIGCFIPRDYLSYSKRKIENLLRSGKVVFTMPRNKVPIFSHINTFFCSLQTLFIVRFVSNIQFCQNPTQLLTARIQVISPYLILHVSASVTV